MRRTAPKIADSCVCFLANLNTEYMCCSGLPHIIWPAVGAEFSKYFLEERRAELNFIKSSETLSAGARCLHRNATSPVFW